MAALILAAAALPGCRATPGYQGGNRSVLATYHFRTLTAELPQQFRIPAVMAAASQAMADRGYSVQPGGTEDEGRVDALAPDAGDLDKTVVRAQLVGAGTRVQITIEPLGDQAQSRAILDGILARLGI